MLEKLEYLELSLFYFQGPDSGSGGEKSGGLQMSTLPSFSFSVRPPSEEQTRSEDTGGIIIMTLLDARYTRDVKPLRAVGLSLWDQLYQDTCARAKILRSNL